MYEIHKMDKTSVGRSTQPVEFYYILFVDLEKNECLEDNGGCWMDKDANITACKVPRLVLSLYDHPFFRL